MNILLFVQGLLNLQGVGVHEEVRRRRRRAHRLAVENAAVQSDVHVGVAGQRPNLTVEVQVQGVHDGQGLGELQRTSGVEREVVGGAGRALKLLKENEDLSNLLEELLKLLIHILSFIYDEEHLKFLKENEDINITHYCTR